MMSKNMMLRYSFLNNKIELCVQFNFYGNGNLRTKYHFLIFSMHTTACTGESGNTLA